MAEPKELVDNLEQGAELPSGNEERFAGYGVMGIPFSSGDIFYAPIPGFFAQTGLHLRVAPRLTRKMDFLFRCTTAVGLPPLFRERH
jgi:hypothetical protein